MIYVFTLLTAILFPILKEMPAFAGQFDITTAKAERNINTQLDKIIGDCNHAFEDVLSCVMTQGFRPQSLKNIEELPGKIDQILASESERERAKRENKQYWYYRLLKAVYHKDLEELRSLLRIPNRSATLDAWEVYCHFKGDENGMKILKLLAMHGMLNFYRFVPYFVPNRDDFLGALEGRLVHFIQQEVNNFQFRTYGQPGSTLYEQDKSFAQKQIIDSLKFMLDKEIDPNAERVKDLDGYKHPLTQVFKAYFAATEEFKPFFMTIINMLVEKGATINDEALFTEDILNLFSRYEVLTNILRDRDAIARNVIDKLKREGFDFSKKDQKGRTLLHWACMTPGQINGKKDRECRPLDPEAVGALLETNVDIYAKVNNKTAWDYVSSFPLENVKGALERGREAVEPAENILIEIFYLLLKKGYKPDSAGDDCLVAEALMKLKEDQ